MHSGEFEWDEPKRRQNLRKHGVDFAAAIRIFESSYAHERDPHSHEERYLATGWVNGKEISVCYTYCGEITHIISARRASRRERRRLYHTLHPR